jgi:hypothetical protein
VGDCREVARSSSASFHDADLVVVTNSAREHGRLVSPPARLVRRDLARAPRRRGRNTPTFVYAGATSQPRSTSRSFCRSRGLRHTMRQSRSHRCTIRTAS